MPSKPLLGNPVAVGISAAVMAMRSVVSASAAWLPNKAAASPSTLVTLRISMNSPVRRSKFGECGRKEQIPGQPEGAAVCCSNAYIARGWTTRTQNGRGRRAAYIGASALIVQHARGQTTAADQKTELASKRRRLL